MCAACDKEQNGPSRPAARKKPEAPPVTGKAKVFPKKEQVVRESAGKLTGKLYLKRKDNPRKEGTHGWNSWNLIKDGMTVEAYLQAGGRNNDLRWDIDHGWVELK